MNVHFIHLVTHSLTALYSNFDLKIAWERLNAAHAVVKRQSSDYYPFVDASLRAEKNRSQSQFRDSEVLQLGLSADYEVDLWGKIKSSVQVLVCLHVSLYL